MRITSIFCQSGFTQHRGNMAEYLLPALIIGVAALGALSWLEPEESGSAVLSRFFQGQVDQEQGIPQRSLSTRRYGEDPTSTSLRYQLPNGRWIEISQVPMDPILTMDVDGVNGTTLRALAALDELIEQLENAEAPQETIKSLKQLSSNGYQLADQQKILESVVAGCGKSKQCVQDQIWKDKELMKIGRNLHLNSCINAFTLSCNMASAEKNDLVKLDPVALQSLLKLYPQFGINVDKSLAFGYSRDNILVGKKMHQFLENYAKADNDTKALGQVNHLVEDLSRQIFGLSVATAVVLHNTGTGLNFGDNRAKKLNPLGSYPNQTPDQFLTITKSVMKNGPPVQLSDETNAHATNICYLGKGAKRGSDCI